MPLLRRSLRKQIADFLERPIGMVKKCWKEEDGRRTQPPSMEGYGEAANNCIILATAFMENARVYVEAQREYELWQKEIELARVRKEIEALKLVIPLLVEQVPACEIDTSPAVAMKMPGARAAEAISEYISSQA
jgi:hypothetical protein